MPRRAREKSKTGIYHMILRGMNRQTIFEEEEDAQKFLEVLDYYKELIGYKIYAYCLMGNHIHLLLQEGSEELGIFMRRIGASYVYWYNKKYQRIGHLFQDRYKSEVVEDDKYFLSVLRYIHHNPMKAGLVKDLASYKWSSYDEYLKGSKITETDFALDIFNNDQKSARKSFIEFHQGMGEDIFLEIDEDKKKISDEEGIKIIKGLCNVSHAQDIQGVDTNNRNKYLKQLKQKGITTRQLARLTGINRNVILKA